MYYKKLLADIINHPVKLQDLKSQKGLFKSTVNEKERKYTKQSDRKWPFLLMDSKNRKRNKNAVPGDQVTRKLCIYG